MTSSRPAD